MAYDPSVVKALRRRARALGVPDRYLMGGFEAGIVESGLQNLTGGDADSQGWRQERPSVGYKDPRNLTHSIDRFFSEMAQHDKGQPIGQLVADVQRPREDLRGRYGDVEKQARALMGGQDVASDVPATMASAPSPETSPNIFQTIANLNAPLAQQDPQQAQLQRGWELLSSLQGQQQAASSSTPVTGSPPPIPQSSGGGDGGLSGLKGNGSGLFEMFYDPLGGWKHGQNIGPIGGHPGHLHAAAGPKTLLAIAREADKRGLQNREFEPYDKVDPVHAPHSYHNTNRADDISGDPKKVMGFAQWLKRRFNLK